MKKFLMLFAVVAFIGTSATAQCTKSKKACTKSKTACTKAKTSEVKLVNAELPACPTKAAAVLASQDENIQAKTCASSGTVSYYKKSVCAKSGKVSMSEVKFCNDSKSFVNVAPATLKGEAIKAVSGEKKSCAKKCTKGKTSCTKAKTLNTAKTVNAELPACPTKAAAVLASQNEDIQAKTCASSGTVAYYKKSVCAKSGKVSMSEVKFCNDSKSFVNVAPTTLKGEAVKTVSGEKKNCAKKCTKGAKTSCSSKKTLDASPKVIKVKSDLK